jgi:DNA-binding HxlR family transcriptional regulator
MKETCTNEKAQALEKALSVIGSKWTLLILYNLCFDKKGFNELLRAIGGISPRILSLRLKDLVEHGLVSKTVKPTNPPQVDYAITSKGSSLKTILEQLGEWSGTLKAS